MHFTPLRLLINEVLNAIKDQLWVKRPKLIQYNPTLPGVETTLSGYDTNGCASKVVIDVVKPWQYVILTKENQ